MEKTKKTAFIQIARFDNNDADIVVALTPPGSERKNIEKKYSELNDQQKAAFDEFMLMLEKA